MPRIKCGYHGWEYDRDGVACRIPGGEYFKPMKPREFALDRVRTGLLGRLIFISLDGAAPPLDEFLGAEMSRRLDHAFGAEMSPIATWTVDFDCNWKVLIENTAEDYHITSVHFATSGDTPPCSRIAHTLDGRYSAYENRAPLFSSRSMRWMARQMRPDAGFTYLQYISYPSLIFATSPLTSHLHLLVPTSPTTCRTSISLFLAGASRGLLGRLMHHLLRRPLARLSRRFVEEDRVICTDVQKGLAAARFPGALGSREERVHAFQEYLVKSCGHDPGQ
jgi:phenylpropionate dioxygenase-like ring-hydroxylating dioxygenase large terminal subunit